MDQCSSISSSTSSSLSSSLFVSITTSGFGSVSSFSSFSFGSVTFSSWWSLFSSFSSLFFSGCPGFLGQEFTLNILERSLIACSLLLLFSGFSGKSDFDNGEESFLFDFKESFFSGHKDVNDFFFGDGDDLVKFGNFSSEDFSNPKGSFDKSLGGLDGDELFIFTKEKG